MKAINNKQGSALVWVLVICLIFGLLGIAIGWVALSMNRRSIKNDNLNQSYFTALSTANSVFNSLNGYVSGNNQSKNFYDDLYKNLVYGNKVSGQNYFVKYDNVLEKDGGSVQENTEGMGEANVEAAMSKGHAIITSTATVNDTTETVILDAYRKPESIIWPAKEWATTLKDDEQLSRDKNSRKIYVGNNSSIVNDETKKNVADNTMDVAVYKLEAEKTLSGKLTISRDIVGNGNLEKRAVFIYLEKGATLNIYGMDYELFKNTTAQNVTSTQKDKWFENEKGEYTTEAWEYYYGPDIFIYMEDEASVNFMNPNRNANSSEIVPFPFYITGTSNTETKPKVTTEKNTDVKIYWIQDVEISKKNNSDEWLTDNEGKVFSKNENNGVPSRLPLSGYKQAGKPYNNNATKVGETLADKGGILQNSWEIYQYERKKIE